MMHRLMREIKTPFSSLPKPPQFTIPTFDIQLPWAVYNAFLKRSFDIAASGSALIAVSPLLAMIAILVKLDSHGPIFYSQTRVGRNRRKHFYRIHANGNWDRRRRSSYGQFFRILKFRSMQVNAEAGKKAVWCAINDPRVTRIGNILRKTHLDELPQLINILRGDMTLVGPRPERPEVIDYLVSRIPAYPKRLQMRPGLTGLAQICHRSDLELRDVKRKLRYDRLYFKSLSLWTDTKIVLGTVPFMLGYINKRIRKSTASAKKTGEAAFPSSYTPTKPQIWEVVGISKN